MVVTGYWGRLEREERKVARVGVTLGAMIAAFLIIVAIIVVLVVAL